jgi:hypothetical protein
MTERVAIVLLALGFLVAWYAYFGYPLLLRLVSLARPRPAPAHGQSSGGIASWGTAVRSS